MQERSAPVTIDEEPVKVLVVDDLPEKRLVLETVLRELGPGVVTVFASSGEEALQRVLEHDFAVILLDINMPGMDGLETAGYIRRRKKSAHTPIIFMTAFADEMLTNRGYSLGAVDYVLAPIDPAVLRTKVGVFVELSRKTQQIMRQAEARIALVHEQAARAAAEEATRRSQFLSDASKALAESLEVEPTLEKLARLMVPTLADVSIVLPVSPTGEQQKACYFFAGIERKGLRSGEFEASSLHPTLRRLVQQAIDSRSKMRGVAASVDFHELFEAQPQLCILSGPVRMLVAYPLMAFGNVVGVVALASGTLAREQTVADISLTDELVDRGGIALENAKLYQDVRDADRRKDEFLAMLAHELRNPLAPIRNAAQVLRLIGLTDPVIVTARDTIDRQVTHMVRLIDDLLDVSRLSRGKISLQAEIVDLGPLLANVCDDFRPLLEQAGLQLHVDIVRGPMLVEGDSARLAQVLANILQNASKFTNPGGRVSVRLGVAEENNSAVVQVRDTGIGMEPQMLVKAFDAFSQADRSLDRSRGGLGLGLALVKGLVELHHGTVRAASEGLDRGTTIIMEFPLAANASLRDEPAERESVVDSQHRILIVEDNRDAANMLRMLLTLKGNAVEVAYEGAEAIKLAEEFCPSVVLCDIGLPGEFNGYSVASAMRQHPTLSSAYLVAVTGYGRAEDREKSHAAGFDAHLTKPVSLKDLMQLLDEQEVNR